MSHDSRDVWATPLTAWLLCGWLAGCGSGPAAPPEAPHPDPSASTAAAADDDTANDDAVADELPPEESSPEQPPPTDDEGRDILYRMTGSGVVAETDGVRLTPKVEPVRRGGGWGLRIVVEVTGTDRRMHRLLSPDNGPLMLAARVTRRNGKTETFGDERNGEDEVFVTEGDTMPLSREFPGKDGKGALRNGDKLEVFVGLWGLSADADRRRPIRRLFAVNMVAGRRTPQPIVSAPK